MDTFMELLKSYMIPVVVGICLFLGWLVKHCTPIPNRFIPLIVSVLGVLLAIWVKQSLTPEVLLAGLASGLASTGLHQLVDKLVQGQKEDNENVQ